MPMALCLKLHKHVSWGDKEKPTYCSQSGYEVCNLSLHHSLNPENMDMSKPLKARDIVIAILFTIGVIAGWNFGMGYF